MNDHERGLFASGLVLGVFATCIVWVAIFVIFVV